MRWLALLFALGACDTASPAFRGLPATRIVVEGSTFDVRVRGKAAEAVRVNAEYAPRFGPIRGRAARAMAQVSGCRVTRVGGDAALAWGKLDCGDRGPAAPIVVAVPLRVDYACTEIATLSDYAEFDCQPI